MLPIATYFTIGPYKSNYGCQTNANRNLGLSKFYSAFNILLSLAMYVALLVTSFQPYDLPAILVTWGPVLVIGIVFN